MSCRKRIALVLATLVVLVGCDQKTKALATEHLRGAETKSFLADTVRLDYTENPGAFLSLGASLPPEWRAGLFTIACSVGIAVILLYAMLAPRRRPVETLALSLICAGGIGNLLDRWMYGGHVRDFLNVGLGFVRTGIFNMADVTLLGGCLMLLLQSAPRTSSRVS